MTMLHSVWHLKSRENVKFCHIDYAYKNTSYLSNDNPLTFDNIKGQCSTGLVTQELILNGPQGNLGQCWEILQFEICHLWKTKVYSFF